MWVKLPDWYRSHLSVTSVRRPAHMASWGASRRRMVCLSEDRPGQFLGLVEGSHQGCCKPLDLRVGGVRRHCPFNGCHGPRANCEGPVLSVLVLDQGTQRCT